MKRVAALVTVLGLSLTGLAACSKSGSGDTTAAPDTTVAAETTAPAATTAQASAPMDLTGKTVVYLINGALGDKSFYDSGKEGIDAIAKAYGVKTRTLEANFDAAKYQTLVDAAFEEGDIVFAIAYGFEDALKAAAKAHPDKPVINIDFDIKDPDKHVTSVDYVEEESAFLAGAAAALATTDPSIPGINPEKKIGVVGGDVDPVVDSFLFAYENGAKSIDKDITVERKYLGGAWDDQAKGKQAAEQLYASGSDVVFQVAAAAGLGVLQAAKDKGLYAIGVDTNQNDLQPGHVLASDVKHVGDTIVSVTKSIADGTYQPGVVLSYGIKAGGVDLDLTSKTPVLPAASQQKLKDLRQQIIDGTLVVQRYVPKA